MKKTTFIAFIFPFTLSLLVISFLAANAIGLHWVGGLIGIILVFVIPGWLIGDLLFDVRTDIELRFIVGLVVGSIVTALEIFGLSHFIGKVSGKEVIILSAIFSYFFYITILIRKKALFNGGSIPDSAESLFALLFLSLMTVVLIGFLSLHIPSYNEGYSELYDQSFIDEAGENKNMSSVVIVNHEKDKTVYRLICEDDTGNKLQVFAETIAPETQVYISYYTSNLSLSFSKLKLTLYKNNDNTGYRWIEVPGNTCRSFSGIW